MSKINQLDVHEDYAIYRYSNGIKLIRPDKIRKRYPMNYFKNTGYTVESFMKLPFNIGFVNCDYSVNVINEASASSLGFISPKAAEKKSIYDVACYRSAEKVVQNYKKVFKEKKTSIQEELILLKNNNELHRILFHLPVYNELDNIVGLTGLTIIVGIHSIADSIKTALQLDLLSERNILPEKSINQIYLSKKELDCLRYYVHGKSAREVALILNLSKRTIESYLQNIKIKLNVHSKSELIEKTIPYFSLSPN